MKKNPASV